MKMHQLRVDVPDSTPERISAITEALKSVSSEFYYQFENGEETGKLHIQGWFYTDLSDNHLKNRSVFATYIKSLNLPKTGKCLGKVNSPDDYMAYIIKNTSKPTYKLHFEQTETVPYSTTMSYEELEELYEKLPTKTSGKYNPRKGGQKRGNFIQRLVDDLGEQMVQKTITNSYIILYDFVPGLVFDYCGTFFQKMGKRFFLEICQGVLAHLETKYIMHEKQKKLKNDMLSFVDNELSWLKSQII